MFSSVYASRLENFGDTGRGHLADGKRREVQFSLSAGLILLHLMPECQTKCHALLQQSITSKTSDPSDSQLMSDPRGGRPDISSSSNSLDRSRGSRPSETPSQSLPRTSDSLSHSLPRPVAFQTVPNYPSVCSLINSPANHTG